jgi:Uma2 family endonuclease
MATIPKTQAPWGEYVPLAGPMTIDQFARFPGRPGWMYELHGGRVIAIPGAGKDHKKIQSRVTSLLDTYLMAHSLGIMWVQSCYVLALNDDAGEILCPDLSYVEPDREDALPMRGQYNIGAPDLAIEIALPSDTDEGLAAKAKVYLEAEVQVVLVLWPETHTLDIWQSDDLDAPIDTLSGDDVVGDLDSIPGFSCQVQDFFAE